MPKPNDLSTQAMNALRQRYQALHEDNIIAISPAFLAKTCYENDIDPVGLAPPAARGCAEIALRQMARSVCRQHFKEQGRDTEQSELFGGNLQPRYPAHRHGEEVYVQRKHLTEDEYDYNIQRLRSEGGAKLFHADALEAEKEARFKEAAAAAIAKVTEAA